MNPRDQNAAGLEVEGVSHAFGAHRAVTEASLTVRPGEILCLFGPSGCGKSTLLRIIAGLERLQQGRVVINGRTVGGPGIHVPPEERSVTLLFQDFALFPHLTVLENVTFGLRHLKPEDRLARAREVLEQVGMLGHADKYPHMLSGGEQQRVALARARAPRPRVMLLDEPFSNLDVQLKTRLRDMVLHVLKKTTAATVVVTHDPEEAMFMGDRIAVMSNGRIVQAGTPRELYSKPKTPFVAALFGDVNKIPGTVVAGHVETAIGRVCAPGYAEGAEVEILLRPECLALEAQCGPGAAMARVETSRMLGHTNVIHLSVAGADGTPLHLHARTMGAFLPRPDDTIGIRLDQEQVFVFPAQQPNAEGDG